MGSSGRTWVGQGGFITLPDARGSRCGGQRGGGFGTRRVRSRTAQFCRSGTGSLGVGCRRAATCGVPFAAGPRSAGGRCGRRPRGTRFGCRFFSDELVVGHSATCTAANDVRSRPGATRSEAEACRSPKSSRPSARRGPAEVRSGRSVQGPHRVGCGGGDGQKATAGLHRRRAGVRGHAHRVMVGGALGGSCVGSDQCPVVHQRGSPPTAGEAHRKSTAESRDATTEAHCV